MKRIVKCFFITVVSIGLGYSQSLEETLESMAKANAQGYLGPMVTAFGMGINSGTYHNAKPHSLLGFDFKLGISFTSITDAGKTFDFALPDGLIDIDMGGTIGSISLNPSNIYEEERTSSTMFGENISNSIEIDIMKLQAAIVTQLALDNGVSEDDVLDMYNEEISTAVNNSGIPSIMTPKGLNLSVLPMVVPQVSIGLPMDLEITFRGIPAVDLRDVGELTFFGFGGKIGLNQFIPIPNIALPRIAVGYYSTNLAVGDIMKMKNSITTLQASKSIPFLTVYGGFGLESSSMDVDYTYTDELTSTEIPVKFSLDGENKFRTTVGVRLKLAIITINTDYNIGEFNTVNIGVGLTLR